MKSNTLLCFDYNSILLDILSYYVITSYNIY